jgi:hypothetical protein
VRVLQDLKQSTIEMDQSIHQNGTTTTGQLGTPGGGGSLTTSTGLGTSSSSSNLLYQQQTPNTMGFTSMKSESQATSSGNPSFITQLKQTIQTTK